MNNQLYFKFLGLANDAVNRLETKMSRRKMVSRPVVVDVVLTKACNLACVFCKDYETPEGARMVSLEKLERTAHVLFPTARSLNICSGGEPYLHTGLIDVLRLGKRYGLNIWLLSNGTVFNRKRVETILNENLVDQHGFSVDGFLPETVESIRLNSKLSVILNTIKTLISMRDELGRRNPRITIRYALMHKNINELPDAVKMWGDIGVDVLECGYLGLANDIDPNELLYYHQPQTESIFEKARSIATRYPKLKLNLPNLIKNNENTPTDCTFPWRFVMIDVNGQVLPCYRSFEAFRLPSVYESGSIDFENVWNSDKYLSLRNTVNKEEGHYFPYCGICETRYCRTEERPPVTDRDWQESVKDWLPNPIDHKRPVRGTAHKT